MDLCTLEGLKTLIEIDADNSDDDAVLSNLISSVSKQAENAMRRTVQIGEQTEYFSVNPGDTLWSLKAYPVTVSPTVYHDLDREWGADTEVSSDNIVCDAETGLLYIEGGYVTSGFRSLKVVYTGGMASNTEELILNYADLVHAIERQVAFLYKTRTKIGVQSINTNTGGVTWESGIVWLKEVKAVLDSYKRVTCV